MPRRSAAAPQQPMSERDFAARGGGICPFCRHEEPDFDSILIDGDMATQGATCGDCGAQWIEEYTMSGYSVTRPPDEDVAKPEPPEDPHG